MLLPSNRDFATLGVLGRTAFYSLESILTIILSLPLIEEQTTIAGVAARHIMHETAGQLPRNENRK
jgi:hypothetical protein